MGRIEYGKDAEQMLCTIHRHSFHAHEAVSAFTPLYVKTCVEFVTGFHSGERSQETYRVSIAQHRGDGSQAAYIYFLYARAAGCERGCALAGREDGAVELIYNRIGLPPGFYESQKAEKHKGRP